MFTGKIWLLMTLVLFVQSQTTETLQCPVGRPCMCKWDSPDTAQGQSVNTISCKKHHMRTVPTLNTTGDSREYQKIDYSLNNLNSIPDDYFKDVAGLEEIRLTLNTFASIPIAVSSLSGLRKLYFGGNRVIFPKTMNYTQFGNLSSLDFLDLQTNLIETLYAGSFKGLPSLISLHLYSNNITQIEQGVWKDVPKLQRLGLSGNYLTRINDTDFLGLSNLITLNLTNNDITSIMPESFRDMKNLHDLDLSFNKIRGYLHSGTFNGLPNLKYLYLTYNSIIGLAPGVFENLDSIDTIDLFLNDIEDINVDSFGNSSYILSNLMIGANQIVAFPDGFFEHFPQLTTLYLSGLSITEVPDIRSLSQLDYLDLSYTHITDVYPCDFDGLEKLDAIIWANSLMNCNCNAKWLKQWYEQMMSKSHKTFIESIDFLHWKCSSPPSLKGKAFHQLNIEDLVCDDNEEAKWCHNRYSSVSPVKMSIMDFGSTSVEIKWNISSHIIPKVFSAYLKVYPVLEGGNDVEVVRYIVHTNATGYEVKNLSPGKTYNICLTLVQEYGINLANQCIKVDTTDPKAHAAAAVTLSHGILGISITSGMVLVVICVALLYVFCRKFRTIRGHYQDKNNSSSSEEQVELPSGIVLFDPAQDETIFGVGK